MQLIPNLTHYFSRTKSRLPPRFLLKYQCSCYHSGKGVYGHRPGLSSTTSAGEISQEATRNRNAAPNFFRLVENFRTHGHRIANVNPLVAVTDADKYLHVPSNIFAIIYVKFT